MTRIRWQLRAASPPLHSRQSQRSEFPFSFFEGTINIWQAAEHAYDKQRQGPERYAI